MKWLRRSIVAIFTLVVVGFVALVAYALYEDAYGRDYWNRRVFDNVTLHSFSDNKWRAYNNRTEEYTTEKINWLSEVPDNYSPAVYTMHNKRGYSNVNTGCIVIDAEANNYHKVWVFSDGLAAVMKDVKIGSVDAICNAIKELIDIYNAGSQPMLNTASCVESILMHYKAEYAYHRLIEFIDDYEKDGDRDVQMRAPIIVSSRSGSISTMR